MSGQPIVPFGKQFREKYFKELGKDITPVNHGSYGQSPSVILDKYFEQSKRQYHYPDEFFVHKIYDDYKNASKLVGDFLKCDWHNVVFVENATTAVNIILRSYPFSKGDKIVIPTTVYGACGNTIKFLEQRYGIVPILVQLKYPLEDEEIIEKFDKVFKQESPKLCLFDTVISMPGLRFPFEKLVELCRKYDVLSLIDGAHSIGLLPDLDLGTLKPDFYTSNLHKWLYVPTGCAVLYVDPKHWHKIHTMPVSHSYLDDSVTLDEEEEKTRLIDRFSFYGTKTYSSINVIGDAIQFRKDICGGEQAINDYCYSLAKNAGQLLAKKWGTSILDNSKGSLSSAMVTIEVPVEKFGISIKFIQQDFGAFINLVYNKMFNEYKTYIPISVHNGKLYARISAQIYNELSDYEYASSSLTEVLEGLSDNKECQTLLAAFSKL
ncbi:pyridoxal phosphate-dependent transferase [Scheffersomyces amazonensis]|uniref:pyridoxal phosphate-dependent transferase n=1 Tax=Scheffersomyces amazonensis TaxID=1078765 RepID=UPI00315D0F0E